jgi:hypothetical protein
MHAVKITRQQDRQALKRPKKKTNLTPQEMALDDEVDVTNDEPSSGVSLLSSSSTFIISNKL